MTEISALTRGLRTGIDTDPAQGAVVPPLYLSSNFSFAEFGEKRSYDYTRSGNPTRDLLAEALTTLEGGHGGTITATGMAAITLCVSTLLRPGDTILIPHDCYGGTWRLFDSLAARGQFDYQCIDYSDAEALDAALNAPTAPRVVWLETPSNPLLRITDIEAVTRAAHAVGALVVADNTFLSPVLQRPFEFGVDAVVHSTTKFINGHSDVVGGAVIAATPELHEEFAYWANVLGITGSPFDSYLTLRGLRTLHTRLRAHQENAEALVETLVGHPAVEAVHYPGLPDHPGHEIAARQMVNGFGGLMAFDVGETQDDAKRFIEKLGVIYHAVSLGATETLVCIPVLTTMLYLPEDRRVAFGVRPNTVRLSAGIEDIDRLIADLKQALE